MRPCRALLLAVNCKKEEQCKVLSERRVMGVREALVSRTFLVLVLLFSFGKCHAAQESSSAIESFTSGKIAALVQEVADTQARLLISGGMGFRYESRWSDHEQGETAEVIGSADGRLSRLLAQNGKPLAAGNDDKERKRLQTLLSPNKLQDANSSGKRLQPYFLELIRAMPQAMLYTPAPGQPQRSDVNRPQVVLDYAPNSAFRPKSLGENALSKLSGRIWIDAQDHHLVRMEIHVDREVNVAGGLVAKVFAGGTVAYDQRLIAAGQYAWTHIHLHVRVRELLVKTIPIDADLTATDIQALAPIPSGAEAIRILLAMQVKTR